MEMRASTTHSHPLPQESLPGAGAGEASETLRPGMCFDSKARDPPLWRVVRKAEKAWRAALFWGSLLITPAPFWPLPVGRALKLTLDVVREGETHCGELGRFHPEERTGLTRGSGPVTPIPRGSPPGAASPLPMVL